MMPNFSLTPNRPNGQFTAAKLAAIEKRQTVFDKTGGKCSYCGTPLDFVTFHTDHAQSSSNGGSNDIDNLLPACSSCNVRKNHKNVEDFRAWVKLRLIQYVQSLVKNYESTQLLFDDQTTAEIFTHLQEVERLLSRAKVTFYLDSHN